MDRPRRRLGTARIGKEAPLNWRWTARRVFISAFLIVHCTAVMLINLPASALRQATIVPVIWYLLPIGLDQAWGMFAPNPVQHNNNLEVMTVDSNGIQRIYVYPKMTDFTIWQAIPRVRHSKFASNIGSERNIAIREYSVRNAIRQLKIPTDAFPVTAELYYLVTETPPLGGPPRDPLKPPTHETLQTYRFPNLAEVMP